MSMSSASVSSVGMSSDYVADTTEVADRYLGNISEDRALESEVALDQKHERCLEVFIDRQDARKGRIFAKAQVSSQASSNSSSISVGIVKGRDWVLREGDVMMTQRQQRVLIRLKQQQVIALQFDRKVYNSAVKLLRLGHAMGNAHWSVVMVGETLYVEVTADVSRMEATIREMVESLDIRGLHIVCEFKDPHQFIDFSTATLAGTAHAHSHTH